MVHSVSGCSRGVQVKLKIKMRDPLRMRAIPECLRGVITIRCYTNPRLPYLTLMLTYYIREWSCTRLETQSITKVTTFDYNMIRSDSQPG